MTPVSQSQGARHGGGANAVAKSSDRGAPARRASPSLPLISLAVLVGVLGAIGAAAFHAAVDISTAFFHGLGPRLGVSAVPAAFAAGGVALLALEALFPGDVLGYGFPRFLQMLHLEQARMKRRWIVLKTLGTALSLGAGASVGREGPIAQIGGSIAAAVARLLGQAVADRKVLVACGTAAGVAANFNAPIGAVLFAQEIVLLGQAELPHLSLVVVSAATAVATTRGIFGTEPLFHTIPFTLRSSWECVTYAMLGPLLGLLAVGYIRFFHATVAAVGALRIPRSLVLLAGLSIVALVGMVLPANLADGYETINAALTGQLLWSSALALGLAKILTSVVSLSCGAPGGVFGPIFFIGAMAGCTFRALAAMAVPGLTGPNGSYALVGLGAFLAATTHAPMTAVFLLFELTQNYSVAVPALLTVGLAILVSHRLEENSIDTFGLAASGTDLHASHRDQFAAETVSIAAFYQRQVPMISQASSLAEVLRIIGDAEVAALPVVDADNALVGVISSSALRLALAEGDLAALVVARDLCDRAVPTLTEHSTLAEASSAFELSGYEALPVVDPSSGDRVLGVLPSTQLFAAYNEARTGQSRPSAPEQ